MTCRNSPQYEEPDRLYFAPLAWLKLQWFCHAGNTEVGGFGISAAHNPLYIEEFITLAQRATPVTVAFDDAAVADYFDRCVDRGLNPARFARVWLHTHPGESPLPSFTDEETFSRRFGSCDWSVMAILSRTGQTYARLAFSAGPGAQMELPVSVHWEDFPQELSSVPDFDKIVVDWVDEYAANISYLSPVRADRSAGTKAKPDVSSWWNSVPWNEALDSFTCEPIF